MEKRFVKIACTKSFIYKIIYFLKKKEEFGEMNDFILI